MDKAEGGGAHPVEQFHRNEAISAVTDEGFGEEDDDDYEDLYNDVNVGEGFLQSLRKNNSSNDDELGFSNVDSTPQVMNQPPPAPPEEILGVGVGERKLEGEGGYQNQGYRPPNVGMGGGAEGVSSGVGRGYGGLRVELSQRSSNVAEVEEQAVVNSVPVQGMGQPERPHGMSVGNVGTARQGGDGGGGGGGGSVNGNGGNVGGGGSSSVQVMPVGASAAAASGGSGGGTILFVGDLHWWTTDEMLESELVKYGPVKEVKFFDEKASGKSKGYCQVEFYDPAAASACKEGMNGHVFNGRPCVVAFASPYTVKRMGEAQVNRNQQATQQAVPQGRRPNDAVGSKPTGNNISTGGNYQGGDQNRNFMRGGNWRGNSQGMGGGRGPVGPIRNRPSGMAGRGMMGNGGNGFGQGMGPAPPMMHPQAMMGQGFDPGFGAPMGRMGNYGGFPGGPQPPFQGLMSSFPPVGNVGMPGVAPHVNPAFFGRGMPMNAMGMMPNAGVDGPNMGMWQDPNMGGWGGDEHGGRPGESSYGEEAVSDHQYEASHERTGWQNPAKEKDRGSEREFSGSTDRRYRDDREPGYDRDLPREKEVGQDQDWPERRLRDDRDARDREKSRDRDREKSRDRDRERSRDRDRDRDRERDRDRYRDDRDRYADHHRYKDREADYDDEWDRGRSSRTHSKSRVSHEEERSRSRDADYGKRRRITSE